MKKTKKNIFDYIQTNWKKYRETFDDDLQMNNKIETKKIAEFTHLDERMRSKTIKIKVVESNTETLQFYMNNLINHGNKIRKSW